MSGYAGTAFMTAIHMTTWKTTNETSYLFIEEYLNSTHAFDERKKYMFIPNRMVQGTCWSHSCDPLKPYKRYCQYKSILKYTRLLLYCEIDGVISTTT